MAKAMQFHKKYSSYPATANGANRLGSLYYYTGKECKKGHLALRYASSSNCVECIEAKRGVKFDTAKNRFSEENINLAIAAMAQGFLSYQSKTPCPQGHYERFTSSNNCVACNTTSLQKRRDLAKWARVKKLYGITQGNFNEMLSAQNSLCAICEKALNDKNTHIDHCHATGRVRSLLCSKCNQAIGLMDEDKDRFFKAAKYLEDNNNA